MLVLYNLFYLILLDSYEQGLRRMRIVFSDSVVYSSNLDEQLSSEEEADPFILSKTDLIHSLMNVNANLKNTDLGKTSGNFSKLCVLLLYILIICIDVLISINFLSNR